MTNLALVTEEQPVWSLPALDRSLVHAQPVVPARNRVHKKSVNYVKKNQKAIRSHQSLQHYLGWLLLIYSFQSRSVFSHFAVTVFPTSLLLLNQSTAAFIAEKGTFHSVT